jgi:hypothetical protein
LNILAGTWGHGVFLSTDSGSSWTDASTGLEANANVYALAIIGSSLFAGTDDGVFISSDKGTSWHAINNGLQPVSPVAALAVSGTNLFAASNIITTSGIFLSSNIYLSSDNGKNWVAVNSGLPNTFVTSLVLSDTVLFAGMGDSGVWRRSLSDFAASGVNNLPSSVAQSIISYPNPCTSSSTITFSSAESGAAEVTIFNLLGAEVARVYEGELSAGEHSFTWDASSAAPGMYECVVNVNGNVQRTAISLLK